MHILRKLKTLHACKPIVGDSQSNIRNLKNGIIGAIKANFSAVLLCCLGYTRKQWSLV